MNVPESYSESAAENGQGDNSYRQKTSRTSKALDISGIANTPQKTKEVSVSVNKNITNITNITNISETQKKKMKPSKKLKKLSPVRKLKNKFKKNGLGLIDSYFNAYFIYFLKKSEKKIHESGIHKKNIYGLYMALLTVVAKFIGLILLIPAKTKKLFTSSASTAAVIPVNRKISLEKSTSKADADFKSFCKTALSWTVTAASIICTVSVIFHISSFQPELQIYVDGESVGLVKSVQNLDNSIAILEQNISSVLGMPYKLSVNISYKLVLAKDPVYLSNLDLHNALYNFSQDLITSAYGLYFDGKLIGAALSEEDVDTVLQKILYEQNELDKAAVTFPEVQEETREIQAYDAQPEAAEFVETVEVNEEYFEFLNEVRVVQAKYPKRAIMSSAELKIAIEIAANSKQAISSTIDNALTEAQSANTLSRDYIKLSPSKALSYPTSSSTLENPYYFSTDTVFAGTGFSEFEVQFKKIKSETSVVEVPFAIEYKESDEYYQSTKIVEIEGLNGENIVTAQVAYVNDIEITRNVLDVKMVSEPVNQVVIIGTKALPTTEPTGKLICPVAYRYMTDKFMRGGHRGIDYVAPFGTKIVAADGGTVVFSGESESYGLHVIIKHAKGTETLYAHMSERLVEYGEKVFQGQAIGKVGSTGNSTGNHLHFEVQIYGELVDPLAQIGK